ncbi:MAG TPA: alkaline phosphatase family protein [Anaerolineae bacterium]|nr:alkaline phosphatase family protein [Anaerolineae bacterium]
MIQRSIAGMLLFIVLMFSAACTTATPTSVPTNTPTITPTATRLPPSETPVPTTPAPPTAQPIDTPTPTNTPTGSTFSHVYVIVMENKGYDNIVGNAAAPYINSLIADYGLATHYNGVAHPSQPNYLALFSGSTQGIADDAHHDFSGQNLADQLEAQGLAWKVFAQNVPPDCFTGATATDGEDGTGTYARKHEPAISFTDISSQPDRCANITDFTHFDPAAADFEFIAPNLCNDMHDCSVATGDAFLRDFVPQILNSPAWQQGGVLFITWDEGEGVLSPNHVPTLVISKAVPKGFQSDVAHDHYSLLRTIEDAWNLDCLNQACSANNLNEFFP